jgi:hypothetical protein
MAKSDQINWADIPWQDILNFVKGLMAMCKSEGTPEPEIKQRFRNPGGRDLVRLERHVRDSMRLSPRQWRKQGDAIMARVLAERNLLEEKDVQELVDQAGD